MKHATKNDTNIHCGNISEDLCQVIGSDGSYEKIAFNISGYNTVIAFIVCFSLQHNLFFPLLKECCFFNTLLPAVCYE